MDKNSLKNELQITLQSKLPELRSKLGLSQEMFAELIGKSRQAVSLFERGELQITWETCLGIVAVAVNRDPDVLMKLYGDDFKKKFQIVVKK
ncbi:MAG: helix-turn-helix transcriptional regulator [Clostridia bacterium]|nr:helix-turn-helix transcriptional regulator [Clostridia bacterium]